MNKILIVDDSAAEMRLMESVLETAGYRPVGLHDPLQIEGVIAMERPQLILLDVVMPQKNGFQVCRELKNHEEFSRIPVIMVTSKNTDSDKFWAERQGADGYVVKPFKADELLREVRRFV